MTKDDFDALFTPVVPFTLAKSQAQFWDDPHISKMMLAAHLHPTLDAASRKHHVIDQHVSWLAKEVPLKKGMRLLDLGCGPGLYCERFSRMGLEVVGIDYSKRSIAYARDKAKAQGLLITYRYENYLTLDEEASYDVITLIYCDFGVLSPQESDGLLQAIKRALKPGGYFICDVWTPCYKELSSDQNRWKSYPQGGFWREGPYLELFDQRFDQKTGTAHRQYVIIEPHQAPKVYHLWEQCYTKEMLEEKLNKNGFVCQKLAENLSGQPYKDQSETLAVIACRDGG